MNAIKNHGSRLASQSAGLRAVLSAMESAAHGMAGPTGPESVKPSPTGSNRMRREGKSKLSDPTPAADSEEFRVPSGENSKNRETGRMRVRRSRLGRSHFDHSGSQWITVDRTEDAAEFRPLGRGRGRRPPLLRGYGEGSKRATPAVEGRGGGRRIFLGQLWWWSVYPS